MQVVANEMLTILFVVIVVAAVAVEGMAGMRREVCVAVMAARFHWCRHFNGTWTVLHLHVRMFCFPCLSSHSYFIWKCRQACRIFLRARADDSRR